jgi:molybdate transport system substrate-binding protein
MASLFTAVRPPYLLRVSLVYFASHFVSLLRFLGGVAIALLLAVGLKACATPDTVPAPARSQEVTLIISAAASLQDVLEIANPLFEQANPGIQIEYNFGSSGALQQQIEQGAPVDLFFSAAAKQMDALQEKDLILADTRRDLLTNRLVLIVPANSNSNLTDFAGLTKPDIRKIAVGEFRSVPAGQYAEELFSNLDLLEQLQPKFVFANNVRGVLAAVESGNVDAGLVYLTDAKLSSQVKAIATAPESAVSQIVYPIAVLSNSQHIEASKTYIRFLSSNPAIEIFENAGFNIKTQTGAE